MKIRLIVSSILAIMIAAGVSHAQHTRLLIGTEGGIWRGIGSGALSLTAGETVLIKLRPVSVSGRVTAVVAEASLDPMGAFHHQVPCDGQSTISRTIGVSSAQLNLSGTTSDRVFQLPTDKRWKGTCRMFAFRLADGSERRAKLKFQ